MNSVSAPQMKKPGELKISSSGTASMVNTTSEVEAKQRALLVEWLNSIFPNLSLPIKASDEELRACLIDGTLLCQILKSLRPVSVNEVDDPYHSSMSRSEKVRTFLTALDKLGISCKFRMSDLEKDSMKPVINCLLTLRAEYIGGRDNFPMTSVTTKPGNYHADASTRVPLSPLFGEERRKVAPDSHSQLQHALCSPVMSESSAALLHQVGHKFHEVFQMKQGQYTDLPAAKISEMMKSNGLDNAPTQSLLSVVNGILDESVERKNGEIPHRVACLLRKVVQEIERRISTQADHLRTQNNLFRAREEKYQSRIRVLEALASGTGEETEIVKNQLQQIKTEKSKLEEKKKYENENVVMLMKEKDQQNHEISALKQELELVMMKAKDQQSQEISALKQESELVKMKAKDQQSQEISALKQELELVKMKAKDQQSQEISVLKQELELVKMKAKDQQNEEISALKQELELVRVKSKEQQNHEISALKQELELVKIKEKDQQNHEISALKHELELVKNTHELRCLQMETEAKTDKAGLEERIKELEQLLMDSRNKVRELDASSELKQQKWSKKENFYQSFMDFQLGALREVRSSLDSIKQEILKAQKSYPDEFHYLGVKLKALAEAAENYNQVLAENRKLFNEVQDLKGNIRVYCRIRPFLPGQTKKQTTIEHIGENGELTITNPHKQGKDGQRMFKFNKVFGPAATQVDVFSDIRPLIRSVLDGYNVCIFAYGQTGSGKTYTMSGPNGAREEDWGVNFRALNDLFSISQKRKSFILYEVAVQMVEIYNEQVRDLLSSDGSQKRLGIMSTSQPNGLAVPDATMRPVTSTADVLELMDIGLKNRAVGATAMNERSSRSHSVVTIHVRGKDLKTNISLHGNLHLVDLAGSERVDRSEVTGDRLKEAQHINKSLSALGDVIFALGQKNSHIPYRNSKLTQVLQSSLGGQAKSLMFVQLNPDANSYPESLSALKFAERVSGVELGAARSSKESRDSRELMEQVASLKDTIAKKDEEIERLQLLKDLENVYPSVGGEKRGANTLRYGSPSPIRVSIETDDPREYSLRREGANHQPIVNVQ